MISEWGGGISQGGFKFFFLYGKSEILTLLHTVIKSRETNFNATQLSFSFIRKVVNVILSWAFIFTISIWCWYTWFITEFSSLYLFRARIRNNARILTLRSKTNSDVITRHNISSVGLSFTFDAFSQRFPGTHWVSTQLFLCNFLFWSVLKLLNLLKFSQLHGNAFSVAYLFHGSKYWYLQKDTLNISISSTFYIAYDENNYEDFLEIYLWLLTYAFTKKMH